MYCYYNERNKTLEKHFLYPSSCLTPKAEALITPIHSTLGSLTKAWCIDSSIIEIGSWKLLKNSEIEQTKHRPQAPDQFQILLVVRFSFLQST